MTEPPDREQRSLYGLEGDAEVRQARRIAVENSILPFFNVFVPIFAAYASFMALLAIYISSGSFSPFKLVSGSIGIISFFLAVYIFYISRFKPNLPLYIYLLLNMVLQTCTNTCRVAVNLTEGKPINLFDWIVTPLLIILTLIVWLTAWNLRRTVRA